MATRRARRAPPPRSPRERSGRSGSAPALPARDVTLERLLTSPNGFGLTKATPLQRACWRIAEGLPFDDLLADDPGLLEALERTCGTGGLERLPGVRPDELYILCGIRTAKSLTCAAIALKAALSVDLSALQPYEEASVSVLSLKLAKAKIIMRHLKGALRGALRPLLARKPTQSTVWIRRPDDGRVVRIEIAAGANAGGSLVGDWSAGVIFDEWPRMNGEASGSVINFDDSRKAVLGRLLPGAQLVAVGSPWAPRGPAYETVQEYWGKPSSHIVVLRPPAKAMNPAYWTDARIERLRTSPKGEWIFRTDYLGEFADPESAFFALAELEAVMRKAPADTARDPAGQYFAAMDPATRRNAWTLVIAGRFYLPDGSIRIVIACARQWVPRPRAPLKPEEVLEEIKRELARYGVLEVHTDQWASDAIAALGRKIGVIVTQETRTTADIVRLYDSLKTHVLGGTCELPPNVELRGDLLAVRKVVTNQAQKIALPITSDGRHCDYAPATALVVELAATAPSWVHAMNRLSAEQGDPRAT